MAADEVSICNRALSRVGNSKRIATLDDTSSEAKACSLHYAACRDEVLAAFRWPFATKHAQLALLTGVTRSGWTYAYALPVDCVEPHYLFNGARPGASLYTTTQQPWASPRPYSATGTPIPFAIEDSDTDDGQILLTDWGDSAELVYTQRITKPAAFPALFASALSWRLAMELALVLPVKQEKAVFAQKLFLTELSVAEAKALNGQQDDAPADARHITIRG